MYEVMGEDTDRLVIAINAFFQLRDKRIHQLRMIAAAFGSMPVHQINMGVDGGQAGCRLGRRTKH